MSSAPGRPVIWSCWTPREEVSALLDFHIKRKCGMASHTLRSLVISQTKFIHFPVIGTIFGRVDVVGLYLSKSYKTGLKTLR